MEGLVLEVNKLIFRGECSVRWDLLKEEMEGREGWYGIEDCSFEYLVEEDYDGSDLLIIYNGDRGGINIFIMYRDEVEKKEYEILSKECIGEVKDGKFKVVNDISEDFNEWLIMK